MRIDSNTFGAGNLQDVAFRNPDGSNALIVLNADSSNAHTFNVNQDGQYFTYTLPAKAVATFTWTPGASGGGGSSDTTAPSAPSGLAATGTTASSTTLNWTAATDNVGVTGYQIIRNGAQVATTTSTSYTDTGLSAATSYSYTVKAVDAAGNVSAASNTASVTTTASGGGGGAAGIDSTKWYQVINTNSHKCVDAAGGGTSNGTPVQQWSCASGNTNQQWQFQATDNSFYKVVTRNAPALGWDVTGGPGATGNGTKIQLWTNGGGTTNQGKASQPTAAA